jgi:predicted  nucleic acid-binding Zn-ribbon protein
MSESNINIATALGGVDLVLIIGSGLYFSKKITELSVKIDKVENSVKHHPAKSSSTINVDDNLEADIDELYNRVESLENTIDKLTERQKRSEFLLNQIINSLKDNSISINIDAHQRRISSRRKQPLSQKRELVNTSTKNIPNVEDEEEEEEEEEEDNSDIDIAVQMANGTK